MLRDVPVPDAAPAVVDHDEHVERAEGEGLHREQVSSPDAGRVVAQKRAPRLTRRSRERLLTVAAHGASAHVAAKRTQLTNDADGAPPWILSGDAQDQPLPLGGNVGTPRSATTLPAPVGAPRERCQRTTVSGSTITSVPRQPDQPRASSDQNRRSWRRSRGRRRPGCRRRARGRDLGGRGCRSASSGQSCTYQVLPSHDFALAVEDELRRALAAGADVRGLHCAMRTTRACCDKQTEVISERQRRSGSRFGSADDGC